MLRLPLNGFLDVLLFLVTSTLHLSYHSSARLDSQLSYCGDQELCGEVNVSYPFFINNWGCGLERFDCSNVSTALVIDSSDQKNDENDVFEVHSIDYSSKTLLAHYLRFTKPDLLNDNDKCKFLFNNFTTMPTVFHILSVQVISPNLTLRVCNDIDHCKVEALPDVTVDDGPALSPVNNARDDLRGSPSHCKLVQVPMDIVLPTSIFQYGPVHPVSKLFTVGFRLRWILPEPCHHCEKNGTLCVCYDDENVICSNIEDGLNPVKGNTTQTPFIGIGIPAGIAAGILLASLFGFVIYKYQTKDKHKVRRSFSLKADPEMRGIHFGFPIFSFTELREATNNFSSDNELGGGGSGTVFYGKLKDGRDVAIKRLYHHNYKDVERFMNEINILTHLRHQNIVTLYGGTSYRSHELLLVYEFISNGTVAHHLHGDRRNDGALPWLVRMSIAIETASALFYLHASDIIHRDVKTSNILVDNHFHVKVADFGLCRPFPNDASHVSTAPQGTPGYVDPEYHRCYQLTNKSDVYSFGVVLIELVSSKPVIDISRHRDEINLANLAVNKIQDGALQDLVDPSLGFESDLATKRTVTLVAQLAFVVSNMRKN